METIAIFEGQCQKSRCKWVTWHLAGIQKGRFPFLLPLLQVSSLAQNNFLTSTCQTTQKLHELKSTPPNNPLTNCPIKASRTDVSFLLKSIGFSGREVRVQCFLNSSFKVAGRSSHRWSKVPSSSKMLRSHEIAAAAKQGWSLWLRKDGMHCAGCWPYWRFDSTPTTLQY